MRKILGGLTLALAVVFTAPAVAQKTDKPAKSERPSKEEAQKLTDHTKLRNAITKKVKYPASKADVVASLAKARIKTDDAKWVSETLPDRSFDTSDDVVKALGWEVTPAADETAK